MSDMEAQLESVQRVEDFLEKEGITLTIPKHTKGEPWKVSLVADVNEKIEEEVVGEGVNLIEAVLDAFKQWSGDTSDETP